MKNYLLYFFAFLSVILLLPVLASVYPKSLTQAESPCVSIKYDDGSIKKEPLEDYVFKVLIGLIGSDTGQETANAFAVSVRSCACYIIRNGHNHKDFDVCSDPKCCFRVTSPEQLKKEKPENADIIIEKAKSACEKTKGCVLTYKNMPAMALFHTGSGERTADCARFPYLVSVRNTDESQYGLSKAEKKFSYKEFSELTGFDVKSAEDAEKCCVIYRKDGRAEFAVCSKKTLSADELIKRLSLPSDDFLLSFTDDGIDVSCFGKGRGFGMSFLGACALEKSGKSFDEILGFYYPLLSLNKIYNN